MVGGFGGRFITGGYRGAQWVAVRPAVDGGEVAVAPPQPWAVGRAGGAELADVEEDEEERRGCAWKKKTKESGGSRGAPVAC
jgi:hypothetical protein